MCNALHCNYTSDKKFFLSQMLVPMYQKTIGKWTPYVGIYFAKQAPCSYRYYWKWWTTNFLEIFSVNFCFWSIHCVFLEHHLRKKSKSLQENFNISILFRTCRLLSAISCHPSRKSSIFLKFCLIIDYSMHICRKNFDLKTKILTKKHETVSGWRLDCFTSNNNCLDDGLFLSNI